MNNREQSPDWAELENDPKFQEELLVTLRILIPEKKFGEKFWWQHMQLSERRAMEDDQGNLHEPKTDEDVVRVALGGIDNPLLPELGKFEKEMYQIDTVEGMLAFARKHGVELTSEEMTEAKEGALKAMLGVE